MSFGELGYGKQLSVEPNHLPPSTTYLPQIEIVFPGWVFVGFDSHPVQLFLVEILYISPYNS